MHRLYPRIEAGRASQQLRACGRISPLRFQQTKIMQRINLRRRLREHCLVQARRPLQVAALMTTHRTPELIHQRVLVRHIPTFRLPQPGS